MLTFAQERQHERILDNEGSQLNERDPKKIRYLRDKRVLMKKSMRRN